MKRSIASAAFLLMALLPLVARAAEEAQEHEEGSWLVLGFFAVNFAIFVFVLAYAAGPQLRKFFNQRATTIHSSLAKSEEAFREAEALARAAAERMAVLEQEVAKLKQELEEETAFQLHRISDLAETNSKRIRHDAELTAAAIVDNARRHLRGHLALAAERLARDLISRHFETNDQNRLLDTFMNRLGQEARQ